MRSSAVWREWWDVGGSCACLGVPRTLGFGAAWLRAPASFLCVRTTENRRGTESATMRWALRYPILFFCGIGCRGTKSATSRWALPWLIVEPEVFCGVGCRATESVKLPRPVYWPVKARPNCSGWYPPPCAAVFSPPVAIFGIRLVSVRPERFAVVGPLRSNGLPLR